MSDKVLDLKYQEYGIKWLMRNRAAYLADDPGLGKSRQVIIASDNLGLNRILVIGPAISLRTWRHQFQTWSTRPLKIQLLEKRSDLIQPDSNVVICSYDIATTPVDKLYKKVNKKENPAVNPQLLAWDKDLLVCDEAHLIKGLDARRSQAVLSEGALVYSTFRAWFVSGTPMPNFKPSEMWGILRTIGATTLNYAAFCQKFCDGHHDGYKFVITGAKASAANEFKEVMAKVVLRRLKKDVLPELPPVKYGDIIVEGKVSRLPVKMTKEQRDFIKQFENADLQMQYKMLEVNAASISTLRYLCGLQKVDEVVELLDDELKNNAYKKIVVFGIHKEVLSQIVDRLRHYNPVLVNGDVTGAARQRCVDLFREDPNVRIFAGNIAAAGSNVTLVAASEMLFVEEDFVPGNNSQAVDRCDRLGQTMSINVRRTKLENSMDDRINEILYRKGRDSSILLDKPINAQAIENN